MSFPIGEAANCLTQPGRRLTLTIQNGRTQKGIYEAPPWNLLCSRLVFRSHADQQCTLVEVGKALQSRRSRAAAMDRISVPGVPGFHHLAGCWINPFAAASPLDLHSVSKLVDGNVWVECLCHLFVF